jgi:hypothetical protein
VEPTETRPADDQTPTVPSAVVAPPAVAVEPARRRTWTSALLAGVAAGLAAWLAGEAAQGAFRPRLFEVVILQQKVIQSTTLSENAAALKNAALSFGILGLVTGLAMGLAGGLSGRCPSRALVAGLGGAAIGGLVGVGASLALLPLFFRQLIPDPNEVLLPVLIHGGIGAAIGAVGGAAMAVGLGAYGRLHRAILGGALGACLATVLFHVLASSFFPDSSYTEPQAASSVVRLLSRMLGTVLIAAGTARALVHRHPAKPTPAREV